MRASIGVSTVLLILQHVHSFTTPARLVSSNNARAFKASTFIGTSCTRKCVSRRSMTNACRSPKMVQGGLESVLFTGTSLLVLTGVVALHELGHLLAARWQGIRVQNYSVGFGPKLVSYKGGNWKLLGDFPKEEDTKEENIVEYSLRALPLGGFVSFPPHIERKQIPDSTSKGGKGTQTKSSEIISSEVMNMDENLLQNRPPGQRAIVMVAGIVANLMVTWACLFVSASSGNALIPTYTPGIVLSSLTDVKGPAAVAGLKPEDVLMSINGKSLPAGESTIQDTVGLIRASAGEPLKVEVLRDGTEFSQIVRARKTDAGYYSIGVLLKPNVDTTVQGTKRGLAEAAVLATNESGRILRLTTLALGTAISSADVGSFSGPVSVVQQGASMARSDGAGALLNFAAVISVNLAVINALPIPGLDGGQLALLAIEAAANGKLKKGVLETINGVGIIALLLLSASMIAGEFLPAAGSSIVHKADSILHSRDR